MRHYECDSCHARLEDDLFVIKVVALQHGRPTRFDPSIRHLCRECFNRTCIVTPGGAVDLLCAPPAAVPPPLGSVLPAAVAARKSKSRLPR